MQKHGFDPWWTCYCFDNAVTRFGLWIENKLYEHNDDGTPVYDLDSLLSDGDDGGSHGGKGRLLSYEESKRALTSIFGAPRREKALDKRV